MQQFDIFNCKVFKSNTELDVSAAIAYATHLENSNPSVLVSGTNGAWQSACVQLDGVNHLQTKNMLTGLVSIIEHTLAPYGQPSLKHLWFNINRGQSFNKAHCHTTPWVAVWYLKTEDSTGSLIFYPDAEKTQRFEFRPEVGDLIIFPGKLYHEVPPNIDPAAVRISCAFNFFV